MSLIVWGMVLIVLGWLIQFSAAVRGKKVIQPYFLLLYSVGSLFAVVEEVQGGLSNMGLLSIAALFLAILVWFKSR